MSDKIKKIKNEPDREIDINLNIGQVLMLADGIQQDMPKHAGKEMPVKYMGKYLFKTGFELTLGVDVETDETDDKDDNKPEYDEGDIILITYIDQKYLFSFDAIITGIRKASADNYNERFEIEQSKRIEGVVPCGYDKYIFGVIPITVPEKQQRREFYRMNISVDIYYKAPVLVSKPEIKTTDKDKGYVRLRTIDLSAGGFRAKSKTPVKADSVLECMVVVGFEALPVTAKILSAKQENKNGIQNGLYDIRAIFCDMSDQIRDRIVRYIFAQQRKMQTRHSRIQFEEEIK